ncbi:hypothetical protein BRARA_A02908 [Brassica rapa]|nr:hypothetical protein BRARA_A02908 [Brassica rapa]
MTDLEGNIVEADAVLATVTSARRRSFPELGSFSRSRRRTRYDIYKRIDASFYGYRDEEDGVLEGLDEVRREARRGAAEVVSVGAAKEVLFEEEERKEREREEKEKEREFVVHVPLPDEKEIEKMVLLKKKMELLREYASEDLVQQEKEAKAMLNIHR